MSPGEKRRRQRKREEAGIKSAALIGAAAAAGGCCGNCKHRERRDGKMVCGLENEWDSYMPVTMQHLCAAWSPALTPEDR